MTTTACGEEKGHFDGSSFVAGIMLGVMALSILLFGIAKVDYVNAPDHCEGVVVNVDADGVLLIRDAIGDVHRLTDPVEGVKAGDRVIVSLHGKTATGIRKPKP